MGGGFTYTFGVVETKLTLGNCCIAPRGLTRLKCITKIGPKSKECPFNKKNAQAEDNSVKLTISSESEHVSESNSDNELSCECGASGVPHKIHCPRNSRQRYRRFSPSV